MNGMFEAIDNIDSIVAEGYSLGDDRESFDVYERTNKFGESLWNKIKENGLDDTVGLDGSQDHVSNLYIAVKGFSEEQYEELARKLGQETNGEEIILYVSSGLDPQKVCSEIKRMI